MKNFIHFLLFFVLIQYSIAQVSIEGITRVNTILNFGNEAKGLVVPRVIDANSVFSGLGGRVGTLIYDYAAGCLKVYTSVGWTSCPPLTGLNGTLTGTDKPNSKVIIGSNDPSLEGGLVLVSPDEVTVGKRLAINLPIISDPATSFPTPPPGLIVYDSTNQTLSSFDGIQWNSYSTSNDPAPADPPPGGGGGGGGGPILPPEEPDDPIVPSNNITIDAIYLAQTHVVKPDYLIPLTEQEVIDGKSPEPLKLISDRDVLVLAHVVSPDNDPLPSVSAFITLNNQSVTIPFNPPTGITNLPTSIPDGFGVVQHSFDDRFYANIPKEWVKPGMNLSITASNDVKNYPSIVVGASNKFKMNVFEIHAFALGGNDYDPNYIDEFASKIPTAGIIYNRVPNILFPEVTIPPTGSIKAIRASSNDNYKTFSGGVGISSENSTSTEWKSALRTANGFRYAEIAYVSVAYNFDGIAVNKGVGGGFHSVQRRGHEGIFVHEGGHAIGLPHWGEQVKEHVPPPGGIVTFDRYPYKGTMFGIDSSPTYNLVHVGPVWAFDPPTNTFIPPTIQSNNVSGNVTNVGKYKKDPMQGGGTGEQEPGFIYGHFSDYSVNRMRGVMENGLYKWDDTAGEYRQWSNSTNSYSIPIVNNGVNYPTQRDIQVIAVMAGKSSVTPQADIVYPPIGPFDGNLIRIFDPQVALDRTDAATIFCPSFGCDYTLKVVQGGLTKYMMLPMGFDPAIVDETNSATFSTKAVNLPASAGTITSIQLLNTPNAQVNGLGAATVVTSWP